MGKKNPQNGTMFGMNLDVEGPWNDGDPSRNLAGKGNTVDTRPVREATAVGGARAGAKYLVNGAK